MDSLALAIILTISTIHSVNGFTIPPLAHQKYVLNAHEGNTVVKTRTSQQSETFLNASKTKGRRTRPSMAQKRKKRGQKFIPKPMERPEILDSIPNPDEWTATQSTDEQIQTMKEAEDAVQKAKNEVQSQASALIETQRRSVQVLTYVKDQVLDLPIDKIIESLQSPSGCDKVFDGFLGEELSKEMMAEGSYMFESNQMELDLKAGVCSGEYSVAVKGGEEQYADCPRTTEFVVSLTRHLTGVLNEGRDDNYLGFVLDETASMAELRTFKRSARQSSIALITGRDPDSITGDELRGGEVRPFQYIVDSFDDDENQDYRKVTVVYFLLPDRWSKDCGGGITITDNGGNQIFVEAKNDRLLVLSSDSCLHRMEEWIGNADGMDGGSLVVTHFVLKQG